MVEVARSHTGVRNGLVWSEMVHRKMQMAGTLIVTDILITLVELGRERSERV